jgi:pyruvate dehydrogenase E2 component (dihydrolipoamide acetyltransferase)
MLAAPAAAQDPAPAAEPSEPAAAEPAEAAAPEAPDAGGELTPAEAPASAFEQNAAKAFDVFPIRVLSAGAMVVGFGAFIVSVPLVGPFGRVEAIRNSWEYFVIGPYDYTFVRPLGEF